MCNSTDTVFCLQLQPIPGEVAEGGGGLIKTDGSVPELTRKVDVMVYEVFDSVLIGEGALHILANARYVSFLFPNG